MLHADPRFAQAVEEAVEQVEMHTDAELVVVAGERSGSYRDLAYLGGFAVAAASLVAILVVPWTVHPAVAVVEVIVTFALAAWVLNGRPFARLLATRRRKDRQVREAMAVEFHHEAVHSTPNRTGVLVYVSALEDRADILVDVGIQGRVPAGRLVSARDQLSATDLDAFLAALRALGEVLSEHVPKLEVDEIDLPNAPRVRS